MPGIDEVVVLSGNTRVWWIEDMAGPANVPTYGSFARAQGIDWPQGERTPLRIPDPTRYGQWITASFVDGQQGLPSLTIEHRFLETLSTMLAITRRRCAIDIQIAIGQCQDPSDFDKGWTKKLILENARPSSYGTDELGTFDGDQNAGINEQLPFTGLDYYEVVPLVPQEQQKTEITDEVIAVAICDEVQCGECGIPSNGYSKIFAITGVTDGSPGLPAELLYSNDNGKTWATTNVSTLGLAEVPSGMACIGSNLVIISADSDSLHYAPLQDILDGVETWTEVTAGFVAAGSPNAIVSLSRTQTWIAGDGGYVYFSEDITAGVEVQTDGSVSSENLGDIAAFNANHLMAVGAANAILLTSNGGETWVSATGPAVGIVLNAVENRGVTELEWLIGTAGGDLYFTRDSAQTWTIRTFPGSGAGQVRDIVFVSQTVGYMAHDTAAPAGRMLRTTSGGNSWYVLPEADGLTMPANDRINSIGATPNNVNLAYGGGLADDGSDGFLVKLA